MSARLPLAAGTVLAALALAAAPAAAASMASNACDYPTVILSGPPCTVTGSMACSNPGFNCAVTTTCAAAGLGLVACTVTAPYRIPDGSTVSGALGTCTPTGIALSATVLCTVTMVP